MKPIEQCEELRKRVAGYAVLADAAKNRGQRKRFEKQAAKSYRALQKFVRDNHLPRELAP